MTPNEYLKRHDRVGQYIHWKIMDRMLRTGANIKPQKVVETESAPILWNFSIHTERTIQTNKPHITVKDHKEKKCKLIDFTFSMDVNIFAKELEKLSKYNECGN